MTLADGIRRLGFRKWYERELLRGHAHLVLVLLCALGVMMAVEAVFRYRSAADQAFDIASVVLCTATGAWALRRYLRLLLRAEALAHQADCPACKAYGRLELVSADAEGDSVSVRCRKCAQEWQIHG